LRTTETMTSREIGAWEKHVTAVLDRSLGVDPVNHRDSFVFCFVRQHQYERVIARQLIRDCIELGFVTRLLTGLRIVVKNHAPFENEILLGSGRPARSRLDCRQQDLIVPFDFVGVHQARLLHDALVADRGKRLAQVDQSESLADGADVGKAGNKYASYEQEMGNVLRLHAHPRTIAEQVNARQGLGRLNPTTVRFVWNPRVSQTVRKSQPLTFADDWRLMRVVNPSVPAATAAWGCGRLRRFWHFLTQVSRLTLVGLPFFFVTGSAAAEERAVRVYTTADGLPSNTVTCNKRDSHGFLWFCTEEGLSRFDGYTFANYGVEQGLPDRLVTDFLETRSGDYLVGTARGLALFDPKSSRRIPMFTVIGARSERSNAINELFEDRQGMVWVAIGDYGVLQATRARPMGLARSGSAANSRKSSRGLF
jgi:hypothetical protein